MILCPEPPRFSYYEKKLECSDHLDEYSFFGNPQAGGTRAVPMHVYRLCVPPQKHSEPGIQIFFAGLKRFSGKLHYSMRPEKGRSPAEADIQVSMWSVQPEVHDHVLSASTPHHPSPPPGPGGARSSEWAPLALSAQEDQVRGRDDQFPHAPSDAGFTPASQSRTGSKRAQTFV